MFMLCSCVANLFVTLTQNCICGKTLRGKKTPIAFISYHHFEKERERGKKSRDMNLSAIAQLYSFLSGTQSQNQSLTKGLRPGT